VINLRYIAAVEPAITDRLCGASPPRPDIKKPRCGFGIAAGPAVFSMCTQQESGGYTTAGTPKGSADRSTAAVKSIGAGSATRRLKANFLDQQMFWLYDTSPSQLSCCASDLAYDLGRGDRGADLAPV